MGCNKEVKNFIRCSKCDNKYHPRCVLRLRGMWVDAEGEIICCESVIPMVEAYVVRSCVDAADDGAGKIVDDGKLLNMLSEDVCHTKKQIAKIFDILNNAGLSLHSEAVGNSVVLPVAPKVSGVDQLVDGSKIPPVAVPAARSQQGKKRKRKILFLADECGSDCPEILRSYLPSDSYAVTSIVKSNAQIGDLVNNIDSITSDFGKGDFAVLLFGNTEIVGNREFDGNVIKWCIDLLRRKGIVTILMGSPIFKSNNQCHSVYNNYLYAAADGVQVIYFDSEFHLREHFKCSDISYHAATKRAYMFRLSKFLTTAFFR